MKLSELGQAYLFANTLAVVHPPETCHFGACPMHCPSEHHMRTWPMVLRPSTMIERICEHGVGHPDPDSVAFFVSHGHPEVSIHGCDGCCSSPN